MSTNLFLYIGSDLIIRALSELYLKPDDQMTRNLFKIMKAAGSELILTEKALEEVYTHLAGVDYEFVNHYQRVEATLGRELVRHIDRILIRAYLYARLDKEAGGKRPSGWAGFVGQFCTYPALHRDEGREFMRRTLCEEFGLSYETGEEMVRDIDQGELDALQRDLMGIRAVAGRVKEKEEDLIF